MISPSRLFADCAGIPVVGDLSSDHEGRCAMCGTHYSVGDAISPFKPGETFDDLSSLGDRSSKFVCGSCNTLWESVFMGLKMKGVACKEGLFKMGSNEAIAYWIENPPKPPFMMFSNSANQAHILWKTPVSLSQEVFFVRLDNLNLKIRRSKVMLGLQAYRNISAGIEAKMAETKKKGFAPINFSRDINESQHGQLSEPSKWFRENNPEFESDYQILLSLSAGDLWALRALVLAKHKERPDLISLSTISSS